MYQTTLHCHWTGSAQFNWFEAQMFLIYNTRFAYWVVQWRADDNDGTDDDESASAGVSSREQDSEKYSNTNVRSLSNFGVPVK